MKETDASDFVLFGADDTLVLVAQFLQPAVAPEP